MAKITQRPSVQLDLIFACTEAEARALDALTGYGTDEFIKVFYEKLGKAYMEQHEAGLRSFLESISKMVPPLLTKADKAREAFNG